jgi:hypothetical protein
MKGWPAAALPFVALVLALPAPQAHADEDVYLQALQGKEFYSTLGPQVLLREGHKVCNGVSSGDDESSLIDMVQGDLNLSAFSAGFVVGAAESGLGC